MLPQSDRQTISDDPGSLEDWPVQAGDQSIAPRRCPLILENRPRLAALRPAWVKMTPKGGCPDLTAANALDPGPESHSVRKAWEGNMCDDCCAKAPASGSPRAPAERTLFRDISRRFLSRTGFDLCVSSVSPTWPESRMVRSRVFSLARLGCLGPVLLGFRVGPGRRHSAVDQHPHPTCIRDRARFCCRPARERSGQSCAPPSPPPR
jgi:hypothetical protein